MAHFAQIDGSYIVIQVIVVNNAAIDNLPFPDSEPVGVAFCQSLFGDTTIWKQTSYNSTFRKNFAGTGFVYDPVLDAFIAPQPGPDWTLNVDTCQWVPPPWWHNVPVENGIVSNPDNIQIVTDKTPPQVL